MPLSGVIQGGRVKQIIGRYRHIIQLVKPNQVPDSTGGWTVNSYAIILTNYAATVEALSASEKWAAHEFASVVTHKVIMRHPRELISGNPYVDGIDASMQVAYNGRMFQVMGKLIPDERPDAIVLMCAEIDDSKNQIPTPLETSF